MTQLAQRLQSYCFSKVDEVSPAALGVTQSPVPQERSGLVEGFEEVAELIQLHDKAIRLLQSRTAVILPTAGCWDKR
jgi:hypothetical protein